MRGFLLKPCHDPDGQDWPAAPSLLDRRLSDVRLEMHQASPESDVEPELTFCCCLSLI